MYLEIRWSTYNEPFQASLKKLVCHSTSTGMLDRRHWALYDILDIEVCPDLI